jgi:hypothetical protein
VLDGLIQPVNSVASDAKVGSSYTPTLFIWQLLLSWHCCILRRFLTHAGPSRRPVLPMYRIQEDD